MPEPTAVAYAPSPAAAVVSTYPPRECGVAHFTYDLVDALERHALARPRVVALDEGPFRAYDGRVRWRLPVHDRARYREVAEAIRCSDVRVLSLQHEYGLFGGAEGEWVLDLLEHVRTPVVTTLHTVLAAPSPLHRRILQGIAERSSALVVLARAAMPILRATYGVPASKLRFIPHGIPPFTPDPEARQRVRERLGLSDRLVVSTFGLIGPGKGLEYALRALPGVVARHPEVCYLILGQTHPAERERAGESYRARLEALVDQLGLQEHVAFLDRHLTLEEIQDHLRATDVYLVPYLNPQQISSGTLAYAAGAGLPVVSTAFTHATELLSDERGVLVPFRDPKAIELALVRLLGDPGLRARLGRRAYEAGLRMRWPGVAAEYAALFAEVAGLLPEPQPPSLDSVPVGISSTALTRMAAMP